MRSRFLGTVGGVALFGFMLGACSEDLSREEAAKRWPSANTLTRGGGRTRVPGSRRGGAEPEGEVCVAAEVIASTIIARTATAALGQHSIFATLFGANWARRPQKLRMLAMRACEMQRGPGATPLPLPDGDALRVADCTGGEVFTYAYAEQSSSDNRPPCSRATTNEVLATIRLPEWDAVIQPAVEGDAVVHWTPLFQSELP